MLEISLALRLSFGLPRNHPTAVSLSCVPV
jgi:hypothetical protein